MFLLFFWNWLLCTLQLYIANSSEWVAQFNVFYHYFNNFQCHNRTDRSCWHVYIPPRYWVLVTLLLPTVWATPVAFTITTLMMLVLVLGLQVGMMDRYHLLQITSGNIYHFGSVQQNTVLMLSGHLHRHNSSTLIRNISLYHLPFF